MTTEMQDDQPVSKVTTGGALVPVLDGEVVLDLPDLADAIRAEHEACEAAMSSTVHHAIRAGELLAEAKAQVAHGEWLPWLAENFPSTPWTAQVYMRLASNTGRVTHLGSVREALAELATPREPEAEAKAVKARPKPAEPASRYLPDMLSGEHAARDELAQIFTKVAALNDLLDGGQRITPRFEGDAEKLCAGLETVARLLTRVDLSDAAGGDEWLLRAVLEAGFWRWAKTARNIPERGTEEFTDTFFAFMCDTIGDA